MKKYFIIFLTFFIIYCSHLLAVSVFATVYYVKNEGNDNASGLSDAQAWKTIGQVNNFAGNPGFSDGDVVQFKRGDTWSYDETLGYNGSPINWRGVQGLTFRDYGTGAKPRLDANTQQPIRIDTTSISNVTIKNLDCSGMDFSGSGRSHIELKQFSGLIIDGVEIDGHIGAKIYNRHYGFISLRDLDGDIEIKNCILQNGVKANWEDTVNNWGKNDVLLIVIHYDINDETKTKGKVIIRGNNLHDVYADCILLNGIRSEVHIYDNLLYNFGENAIDLKISKNCDIYNNKISKGGYGLGGSGGGKSGIVIHNTAMNLKYDSSDNKIRNNYFYDSDYYGIRLLATTHDTEISGNVFKSIRTPISVYESPGTQIHNNVIMVDKGYGITGNNASAIRIWDSKQNNLRILNNSIMVTSKDHLYGIFFGPTESRAGIEIRKNIVQMTHNSPSVYPLYVQKKSGDYPSVMNNCFYNSNHKNRVYWKGIIYDTSSLSLWRGVNNSQGIFNDPQYVDPQNGNLRLAKSSPCLEWGADYSLIESQPTSNISLSPPNNLKVRKY